MSKHRSIHRETDRKEYLHNASMLRGAAMAAKTNNPDFAELLAESADMLQNAGEHICAQGYFGCHGGAQCTSDHK
jgi:hypothetical protein